MINKSRKVKDPFSSSISDIKIFEQLNCCYDYLKSKYNNLDDTMVLKHAKISSACFRQANEFINSANKASLSTSPLLYSYAMNNYLKGLAYLTTTDENVINGFKNHGFTVYDKNILNNLCNSRITINKSGTVASLLQLFDNYQLSKQEISFSNLMRHIPGIEDVYFKTTSNNSLVAIRNINEKNEYFMYTTKFDNESEMIFKTFGVMGNIILEQNKFIFCLNMKGSENLNKGIFNKNNIFYNDYLIFPGNFNEGLKDINIIFYCYLLIMSYGMLVRYNPHKWEDFIDRKISNEAILIEQSVTEAVKHFISKLHQKIFDYTYIDETYSNLDVKKVINNSTEDIMNNITKKLIHKGIAEGTEVLLPWDENIR